MGDISEVNAAGITKITGSDSVGVEQTPVGSTSDGRLKVESRLAATSGTYANKTVGLTAVKACVSTNNLVGRVYLIVGIVGTQKVYWGFDSSVTTANGQPLYPGSVTRFDVTDAQNVYLISGTASQDVRLSEGAI